MSIKSSFWHNFVEWANSPGVIPPLATLAVLALYLIARAWGRRPEPTLLDRVQRSLRQSQGLPGDGREDHWERGAIDERDRRRSRRRSDVITPVALATRSTFPSPLSGGYVLDRSSGGVGLACECDFQLGETIFILPDSPTPDTPWIPVRVKSQRKKEGFSVVGCQFLEPLPLTVQLMLG